MNFDWLFPMNKVKKDMDALAKKLKDTQKQLDDKTEELSQQEEYTEHIKETYELQIEELRKGTGIVIPQNIKDICNTIKNEYPEANITYAGYPIRLKDNQVQLPSMKVMDFIQPIWSHKMFVEGNKLTLKDYLETYKDLSFEEIVDKLRFDIYKKYIGTKFYQYDETVFGYIEYWSTALESWYISPRRMDCENSTLELQAIFLCAGLTGELEFLNYNVCGMTISNVGHSTMYCYGLKDKKWRHFETTIASTSATEFYSLPDNKNTTDGLNIKDVWWSFNSQISRHVFKTDGAKESFNYRIRFKNINIDSDHTHF